MCNYLIVPAPELYDDLRAILEALTLPSGDGPGRAAVIEERVACAASMIRVILGTDAGSDAPRSADELLARLGQHVPPALAAVAAGPAAA